MAILLVLCLVFQVIEGVPIYSLDLKTIDITAQGTCVSGEVCSHSRGNYTCVDCNSSSFPPENTVDGDSSTKWASMPSYQNPSLTFDLGQEQNISAVQVMFGRPPLSWTLDYSTNNITFFPWAALVGSDDECQNFTSYPMCYGFNSSQLSHLINLMDGSLQEETSVLKFTFLRLQEPLQDPREEFVEVEEISISAVCEESFALFRGNAVCPGVNRIYQPDVTPLPAVVKERGTDGQFVWTQTGEAVMAPLGTWFLDNIELHGNGENFSEDFETEQLNSSIWSTSGALLSPPPCSNGSTLSDRVLLFSEQSDQARGTALVSRIPDYQSMEFLLGFVDPTFQCMSNLGEVELSHCDISGDQCQLIGVFALNDCGNCVNKHLVRLRLLISSLQSTLSQLPPYSTLIVANTTDIKSITDQQANYDAQYFEWLLGLVAVERVQGFPSQYPPNITLPTHIASIEVPFSNMELFIRYCDLVDNVTQFNNIRNRSVEILSSSNSLSDTVTSLREDSLIFQQNLEIVVRNLSVLFNQLATHLNSLSLAVDNGNASLVLIISRSYDDLAQTITSLSLSSQNALTTAVEFNSIVEEHTSRLRNITDRLTLSRNNLESVINSSETIINSANGVSVIIQNVEEILNEIRMLMSQASSLVVSIEANLLTAQGHSNTTKDTLAAANIILNTTSEVIRSLETFTAILMSRVEGYGNELDKYIPSSYPLMCMLGPMENMTCTASELHAKNLELNSSRITSESITTRLYAREFLDNLADLPSIDFDGINRTATEAISISSATLIGLDNTGIVELASNVERSRIDTETLYTNVTSLLSDAGQTLTNVHIELNRSVIIQAQLANVQSDLSTIQTGVSQLEATQNYTTEAIAVTDRMSTVQRVLDSVNATLDNTSRDINQVGDVVTETVNTIKETEEIMSYSEEQVYRTQDFIVRTQEALNQTTSGLSDTIQQNNDIISDIETLLRTVDSTHRLLEKINSPAVFEEVGGVKPYISLQPPPGVGDNEETIQFDSLQLYLNANSRYNSPGLLFYAGPLVEPGTPGNDSTLAEDYLAIIDDASNMISVEWRIGSNMGTSSMEYDIVDQSQVYLRRTGSMFELAAGFDAPLPTPTRDFTLLEGSLLFTMSPNTVFLVGGRPDDSRLALTNYETYGSISGTLDLLLYNGDNWTPWNYRRRSNTIFIGSYDRHTAAISNTYAPAAAATSNVLSFDGTGYIRPTHFSEGGRFGISGNNRITIHFRLNSFEGLLMYLYDPVTSISIEVAVLNGNLIFLLKDGTNPDHLYERPLMPDDIDEASEVLIEFGGNMGRFDGDNSLVFPFVSFTDLTRLQAWFGGVSSNHLSEPFQPAITTKGFRGCISVLVVAAGITYSIFGQTSFFVENYLNSPVQNGVSATCFESNYAQQASFNGTDYLSYNSLEVAGRDNGVTLNIGQQQLTLALSFLPLKDNGLLFAAIDGNRRIIVEYVNQLVQVTFIMGSNNPVVLTSSQAILRAWHHLIVEIRTSSHALGEGLSLYVDNSLVASGTLSGFSFSLPSTPQGSPVIYMGGAPNSISTTTTTFVGCLKNFIYNLDAMKFFSGRLTQFTQRDSISFFECPFVQSEVTFSKLPLVFSEPESSVCGSVELEVLNNTIGGFHALSQVLSYNVLPLQSSTWSFQLSLRRYSDDGHVITFPSNDVSLSLILESGSVVWYLTKESDSSRVISNSQLITASNWHQLQISCDVTHPLVTCVSSVGGVEAGAISQDIARSTFYPELPVVLGRIGEERGFVGCLRNLQANEASLGYQLEDLSTCEECYANPIDGWGFTGIGYLMRSVTAQNDPVTLRFMFKPTIDHGLLVYAYSRGNDAPLLAVGLYNGELRATNFTQTSALSDQLFCTEQVQLDSFHQMELVFSQSSVTVSVTNSISGSQSSMTIQTSMAVSQLDINIGGLQDGTYDINLFDFLLAEGGTTLNSPVPGYSGCLRSVEITSGTSSENLLNLVTDADQHSNVLEGLCPN